MQITFNAISEPTKPGQKWLKLFNNYWPAYKTWLNSQAGANEVPDLKTCEAALKKYMPKMLPTYRRLCKLANADEVAARFLTGYQPPAYISGCSQVVFTEENIRLARNYDFHPDLIEGTQLLSAWNGKKVIATSDCLIGAIDGMNEDGLAISLTFGGRKEVGKGFGIPFILRYVLEFCENVEEAVQTLTSIPSHMAYNVTVIDKSGAFKTVYLSPDREPRVTNALFATNHQGKIDWPENAKFNKTLERANFLENLLKKKNLAKNEVENAFLQPPLYNSLFKESFGTLFTAVYKPVEGEVKLRWPGKESVQSFSNFQESSILVEYNQAFTTENSYYSKEVYSEVNEDVAPQNKSFELTDTIPLRGNLRKTASPNQVSWQIMAEYWSNIGKSYAEKWLN